MSQNQPIDAAALPHPPMKVLIVTTEWPTPDRPFDVPFLVEHIETLRGLGIHVDVIHFRGSRNALNYLLAWWSLRKTLNLHKYDLVHAHWGQSALALIPTKVPLVVTFHGSDIHGLADESGQSTYAGRLLQGLSRLVASLADEVIVVSEGLATKAKLYDYTVIPIGVNHNLFHPTDKVAARKELGLPLDKRLILFPANPARIVKRYSLARAAVDLLPSALDCDLIVAWGVPHDRMSLYMNACDLLLVTSDHEGSPTVIKEALACKLPIVTLPVGDVVLQLKGVQGSAICMEATPQAIADCMMALLDKATGSNDSQRNIENDYLWTARRTAEVYVSAIKKHGRAQSSVVADALASYLEKIGGSKDGEVLQTTGFKLAYVTASFPCGNSEEFFEPEFQELVRLGHKVLLVPLYPRGELDSMIPGVDVLIEPVFSLPILAAALNECFYAPRKCFQLWCSVVKSMQVRVVVKNTLVFPKALWLAYHLRRWRPDHIHAYWAACSATMALVASELTSIPWSQTAHRWDITENNIFRLKANAARFTRFISIEGQQEAEARGFLHSARYLVQHLGVQIHVTPSAPVNSERKSPFIILSPGLLILRKGHRYLIEAFARAVREGEDLHLWIAGAGPLGRTLRGQVRRLGLQQRVRFIGHLPHNELLALYQRRKVDAVALASLHEGIPVSLIEAMSYGIPVIGTDAGGTRELLSDGAGILVQAKDIQALSVAILLLSRNRVKWQEISSEGRKAVIAHFNIASILPVFLEEMQIERHASPTLVRQSS